MCSPFKTPRAMYSICRILPSKATQYASPRKITICCSEYAHFSKWCKKGGKSSRNDKGPGEGSGQDDDPLEPCCYEPCVPRSSDPPGSNIYDQRKYGHNLPTNNVNVYFPPLPHLPTGIFRKVDGEVLGLGAGKCCTYKNPEYFSFHHMTFYDMHLLMRCYRLPCPKSGRKP
ncbi:unnamed protein product [Chilo suppressalis]|uniref:NADH dehydrogenase [ubiquinone] flavoprotein 3, mitochondrial n=1 Tax=Chilo suppressalis TaxID=168631 RepID=A0ABN8B7C9_CHISP|nr:unnamed protein product [Chilo suppressalis]